MRIVKPSLILLFLCAFYLFPSAQPQSSYTFQKDDTLLRKKYAEQSIGKKELLLARVSKEYAKDYKTIYEAQFKNINDLWSGTRSVTSPEAHSYLQSIVQRIIAANPELRGTDARVVFSRDWWPNAVSMGDGTIAINAGLVMFMDNEAELVFVVCHELAHYYLEHTPKAIKKYVEAINSEAYQAELKRLSKTVYGANRQLEELAKSMAFNSRRHSRDNEAAADRQAFLFMKKTGYDCDAIRTCLGLLDKVDDSVFYKPLDIEQALNFPDYPFRKKWVQKESAIFGQVTDNSSFTKKEKDSLKTHPDCTHRIALLRDSIQSFPGKKFIVNEELFRQLKSDFFIEISEECYRQENMSRHLYYSLLLLQEERNKPLAVYSVARCFNQLYKLQQTHRLGTTVDVETRGYPEDYNRLLRMLNRVRLDEIASLSYFFCKHYEAGMKADAGFQKELSIATKLRNQ